MPGWDVSEDIGSNGYVRRSAGCRCRWDRVIGLLSLVQAGHLEIDPKTIEWPHQPH